MTNESLLMHYLLLSPFVGYTAIFLGMIIEGDVLLFTAAFLTHQGIFNISYMLVFVFAGTIIGDVFWYLLGFKLNHSFLFLRQQINRISRPFDKKILSRPFHTIFISKFIYGINHALLIRAGNLKLPFSEFILADLAATILWIFLVGGLGYSAGASFALFKHYLRFVELWVAIGLVTIFIFSRVVKLCSTGKLP